MDVTPQVFDGEVRDTPVPDIQIGMGGTGSAVVQIVPGHVYPIDESANQQPTKQEEDTRSTDIKERVPVCQPASPLPLGLGFLWQLWDSGLRLVVFRVGLLRPVGTPRNGLSAMISYLYDIAGFLLNSLVASGAIGQTGWLPNTAVLKKIDPFIDEL